MLEVGNRGLTESRAHFSFWCMLASPLMMGNDLRVMTAETLDILANAEVIALDQDPLGKQGYRVIDETGREVWVKELSDGDRSARRQDIQRSRPLGRRRPRHDCEGLQRHRRHA